MSPRASDVSLTPAASQKEIDTGPEAPAETARDVEAQATPKEEESSEEDHFLVKWDEKDTNNPKAWSTIYKLWVTFQLGLLALCASLGSSIIAPAESAIAERFGVSQEVMVLSVSLYM